MVGTQQCRRARLFVWKQFTLRAGSVNAGEESASFLKKRSKKLWGLRVLTTVVPAPPVSRIFLLFFFKKEVLS
jgi:hypothetical protein